MAYRSVTTMDMSLPSGTEPGDAVFVVVDMTRCGNNGPWGKCEIDIGHSGMCRITLTREYRITCRVCGGPIDINCSTVEYDCCSGDCWATLFERSEAEDIDDSSE